MSLDQDVTLLLDILCYQLDKEQARKLLAISGQNVQAAVQKFYDTDINNLRALLRDGKEVWDDSAFGTSYENYPYSHDHSRAPTRPPSRTSQHSVLSTQAGDAPIQSQYIHSQSTIELMRKSGIESTQVSGVVGNLNTVFGPANRSHYDPSQWAVVPTATEIMADAIPSQRYRYREEGQPAILKPSSKYNYLSALIPILHSIPQFRNALLSPGLVNSDYWVGEDWWRGFASPPAHIMDETRNIPETHGMDILYETQRLMAFLDETDRIYGSADALLTMDAWKESHPPGLEDSEDDLLKFLLLWSYAFQAQVPDANLNGALRSVVNFAGRNIENFVLDGAVTRIAARPDLSIYDVLDDTLFSGISGNAHLTDVSNVLVLRLTSSSTDASDLGCRIPASLYVDRYLEKNRDLIVGISKDIKQCEEQFACICSQIDSLKYHTPARKGSERVESLKLLEASMRACQQRADGSFPNSQDAATLTQLKALYENIEHTLAVLEEQAQQNQQMRENISARFKPIVDDGSEPIWEHEVNGCPAGQRPKDAMHHPYKLWGIATRRDVVYLLHPDIKSEIPDTRQWWRMQYDTETANPIIMRDRLSLQDVLERAISESASVLLVYANDVATSSNSEPLSKPLEQFVKKDNINFLEELQKDALGWERFGDQFVTAAQWNWNKDREAYKDDDWNNVSARDFCAYGDGVKLDDKSSTTLTPNTEAGLEKDGVDRREILEVNRNDDAKRRRESSETIGDAEAVKGKECGVKLTYAEVDNMEMEE